MTTQAPIDLDAQQRALLAQIAAAEQQLVLAEATVIRARTARDELRGAQYMLAQLMRPQAGAQAAPETPVAPEEPTEEPVITSGTE